VIMTLIFRIMLCRMMIVVGCCDHVVCLLVMFSPVNICI
jgi:hypothetical protein